MDFLQNFRERFLFTFSEGVGGVAIRTAQVARGEAHENARQPGEGAFTLQAQVNLIDNQRFGHAENLAQMQKLNRIFRGRVGILPAMSYVSAASSCETFFS